MIRIEGLTKHFPIRGGLFNTVRGHVRAVDGISFNIETGDIFGLAGESGSGKSTIARMIVGLYHPTDGRILVDGTNLDDLRHTKDYRKSVQMVFQNPGSSLNPRRSIGQSLSIALSSHGHARDRIGELLEMVELPRSYAGRYPNELSGGQKQRVAIARALAVEPRLIILDEPTSALDVSVQAKIIELLKRLAKDLSLTFLFISHDLSLMRNFANKVGILYLGRLCEVGDTHEVFETPRHPYTQALISAVPVVSEEEQALKPDVPLLSGEIPSPSAIPAGCSFHTRCAHAWAPCRGDDPEFHTLSGSHQARCHLLAAG